jgi:hypothetical protein
MSTLTPILALIVWTFVIWFWMYATRLPAIRAAKLDMVTLKHKSALDALPLPVKQVADNFTHLHEQPTIFYALAIYSHLADMADPINVALAWAYVAVRIMHSLIQCTSNFIPLRFVVFNVGTVILIAMTVRNVIALFPARVAM